jgi:hypothetical protein
MRTSRAALITFCFAALILPSCRGGGLTVPDASPETVAWKSQTPLPDGIYTILDESESVEILLPEKEGKRVIANLRKFSEKKSKEPPEFLVVRPVPDVPLQLAAPPQEVESDSGKTTIRLELTEELAGHLQKLTSQMQGTRVAVVIGGEVVTTHKIRTPVADGKLQISCCSAGACEYLLGQLTDNVKK